MSLSLRPLLFLCALLPLAAWADPAADYLEAARTPESDFAAAYEAAEAAGLTAAQLLEGRLLYQLRQNDPDALLALVPLIEAQREDWPYRRDGMFITVRSLDGFLHTLKALEAFREGDTERLSIHAPAAFWEWPAWPTAFGLGNLLMEQRYDEAKTALMAGVTVPMETRLGNADGEALTLAQAAEGKKAVLLDFWASWCRPCIELMPALQAKAEKLAPQGIYVAGVNTDDEDALAKAQKMKADQALTLPWLLDTPEAPLAEHLMIDSIPRMVLLSPQGEILFNGHPLDPALEQALAQLGVEL